MCKTSLLFTPVAMFVICAVFASVHEPAFAQSNSYLDNGCISVTQDYQHYRFTDICSTRVHVTLAQPDGYHATFTIQQNHWVDSGYTNHPYKAWTCTGADPGWAIDRRQNDTSPTWNSYNVTCSG